MCTSICCPSTTSYPRCLPRTSSCRSMWPSGCGMAWPFGTRRCCSISIIRSIIRRHLIAPARARQPSEQRKLSSLTYHILYHLSFNPCRCILIKDTSEYRHFKTLQRAYLEVKLAHEKATSNPLPATESASAKTYQAIKCTLSTYHKVYLNLSKLLIAGVMMLKRKLKRIREGRGAEPEDDSEELTTN